LRSAASSPCYQVTWWVQFLNSEWWTGGS
jgi:hypothetical protein